MSEITRILTAIEAGDPGASDQLLLLVYDELIRIATRKMAGEPAGHTLQPTALVHEAWFKLVDSPNQSWQNRSHFFASAAEAMRRILIDRARRKMAQRRGGGARHVPLHDLELAATMPEEELVALDEALERFSGFEPRQAALVKLRFFVGLTLEESAQSLGISKSTAKRWWTYARAWLHNEIRNTLGRS